MAMLRVTVEGLDSVEILRTVKPVDISTVIGGKVTVGIFNNNIQIVRVTGDPKTTMIQFNGRGLV